MIYVNIYARIKITNERTFFRSVKLRDQPLLKTTIEISKKLTNIQETNG